MNKQSIKDFQDSENTMGDTIMTGTCHSLSKCVQRTTQRMNPNMNYGFEIIMMCQIGCNKCTTLAGNVDNEDAYGSRDYIGNLCTTFLIFW